VNVSITNFAFVPQTLTIHKGTIVRWTNNDSAPHTVTRSSAVGPNSGILTQGQQYAAQFTGTGSFPYHCAIHPSMTGSIVVIP
jgi:plastocyanin